MLTRKTTFIVGAGASCELTLPSGDKLKEDIANVLRLGADHAYRFQDELLVESLKHKFSGNAAGRVTGLRDLALAAQRISRGLPLALSIDNFLHTHHHDPCVRTVGMAAIARVIVAAERRSYLFAESVRLSKVTQEGQLARTSLDNPKLKETWHTSLAQHLFSGISKDSPEEAFDNARFIIFNYDRCLEEFLWLAVQRYFDIDGPSAAGVLKDVVFIHPYGALGKLPWQICGGSDRDRSLALGDLHSMSFFEVGKSLSTFTESVRSEIGASVAEYVADAELLLLLGFGYLDQNISLLVPEALGSRGANKVITTAFGINSPNHPVIDRLMKRLSRRYVEPNALQIEPGTCSDLFRNYDLHLRF